MAAEDKCSFSTFHSSVICSKADTFSSLNSLTKTLSTILLTESGLLFTKFTESFTVCTSHLLKIQEQNRSRQRLKCCGIPSHIACHDAINKKRKGKLRADRNLTATQVLEVSQKYGTVLPFGTRK